MIKFLVFVFLSFLIFGCVNEPSVYFPEGEIQGYKPIYGDSTQAYTVVAGEARELNNPGKIYTFNNLLLVNELYEGVHVINNSNPADPEPLYFIKIPGNVDIAMKNNVIYADNYSDLVLIKIGATGVESIKRIQNALKIKYNDVPPASGYFECPDYSKGFVVGWQEVTLTSPKCFH